MKIWLIEEGEWEDRHVVAAVDTDHLGDAIKRCGPLPDIDIDLDCPIELNAIGVIHSAERKAKGTST